MTRRRGAWLLAGVLAATGCGIGGVPDGASAPNGSDAPDGRPEPYRPAYHYTPDRNWMNDPNGPVLADGIYHLFYQYNPEGSDWGNMSWGHATSPDQVHWEELPVAIPNAGTRMIFSGSAVEDPANTSGLCPAQPCLIAVYTEHSVDPVTATFDQTQNLAVSVDGGLSWEPYVGNPVVDSDDPEFRDPNVFWHDESEHWIMVVALSLQRRVLLYRSPNLIDWELASAFGPAGATEGIWECPVLVDLPVDGNPDERRWVLKVDHNPGHPTGGSGAQYFVGDFDGSTFVPDHAEPIRWVDYGPDYYCAMQWSSEEDDEGSRSWIAWMSDWRYAADLPTDPWRGAMTLPQRVSLSATEDGSFDLVRRPVDALADLRTDAFSIDTSSVPDANRQIEEMGLEGDSLELRVRLEPGAATETGLRVRVGEDQETVIVYLPAEELLVVDRHRSGRDDFHPDFPAALAAPLVADDGTVTLHVFVDRSSVEVFAADGAVVLTALAFPDLTSTGVELFSDAENTTVALEAWTLRSYRE